MIPWHWLVPTVICSFCFGGIIGAIVAQKEEGDWRHMETAPKDGTRILAYVGSKKDEANICEIWWEPDYIKGEWGETIGGWDDDWDLNHRPRAWMPRPPAPDSSFTPNEGHCDG